MGPNDHDILPCVNIPKLLLQPLYDFLRDCVCGCPYVGTDNDYALLIAQDRLQ